MRIRLVPLVALWLCGALLALPGCGRPSVAVLNPDPVAVDNSTPQSPDKDKRPGENPKGIAPGQGGYRFPADPGGQQLAKQLPPRENFRLPAERPSGPRPHPALAALDNLNLPLPPSQAGIPRLPAPKATRPTLPGSLLEEAPLLGFRNDPAPPQEPALSPGVLVKAPSPNVSQPVPPPLLGQPVPDRAPLDDPTVEASLAAALAAEPRSRTNPAPFLKLTLPDPFENRQTGRLRSTPPEEGIPVAATPALPK
jgi:hypothetical protein